MFRCDVAAIGLLRTAHTIPRHELSHPLESAMNDRRSHASRRRFLKAGMATAAGVVLPAWSLTKGAPAIVAADSERPQALQGLQLGDPSDGSVIVWSRSDRPARMLVEWSD